MKSELTQLIQKAIFETLGVSEVAFSVESTELSHGDFATNVALTVAKQLGKNPQEVAMVIKAYLDIYKPEYVASIEIAGPGFINLTLAQKYFSEVLKNATEETWGSNELFKGKKILVEHSSPNLFKPFHIGHVMNNAIGESIARLAKYSGAEVTAMSFPSDISLGVAKAIFILLEKHLHTPPQGEDTLIGGIVGDAYTEGVKRYEEDSDAQERIKEIANNLYAQKESPELEVFNNYKSWNIVYFHAILKKLGSEIPEKNFIYESEAGVDGKEIVLQHTPTIFKESEGAIIYTPEESKKFHTAVFINSQGNPTYEAKDLGLLHLKFARYNPDLSIFITDSQQVSHFQVVLDAGEKINKAWKERSLHRFHGRMSFKGQKMSSRLGGVPLAEDILSVITDEVREKNKEVSEASAEAIAIGALKFVILRTMAGKNINFDPDTSLSFEGDSGPYLQYTAVRARSIISKAQEQGIHPLVQEITVTDVERMIARFPESVTRAIEEWAPHHLVIYLLTLAQTFNTWYGNTKIIDPSNEGTQHRLAVVSAVDRTITNGLWLLGIEVPEKM